MEEWSQSENNPVLFCKFQGEDAPEGIDLVKENFMIIIQSPFQKAMATKYASNGMCVDATHGTNDFPLTSLVVLDEYGSGFSIAWCLSNHEDFTHMCIFYDMVKKNCGILTPRRLMSDMASQFYNAGIGIMGGTPLRLPMHVACGQSLARVAMSKGEGYSSGSRNLQDAENSLTRNRCYIIPGLLIPAT